MLVSANSPQRAFARSRFLTANGSVVLLEESHDLPIVDLEIALRTGSSHDPEDKIGLARFTARMIRMGTRGMKAVDVDEAIDRMGAELSIDVGPSHVVFHGSVIRRNVGPFLQLLAKLLARPAFREADLAQVRRETLADIVSMRDNDRALAAKHFRKALFGTHPYGRPVLGTTESVSLIERADVIRDHQTHYVASNLIVGAAGDIDEASLRSFVEAFNALPRGKAPQDVIPEPSPTPGRRVVVVDKPERTQTQIFIGSLGSKPTDPHYIPLLVANTVFGGTFTARLMKEVRSKRGWSYGARSQFGEERHREAWFMWTFPAARDAVACIRLQLSLMDEWINRGITARELRFVQDYLANSYAFEIDTASERLDQLVTVELLGLPRDYYERYVQRVRAVRLEQANAALRRTLSSQSLTISILATASDVKTGLEGLDGLTDLQVVPFED